MREYVDSMRAKYTNLPGSGVRSTEQDEDAAPAQTTDDDLEITSDMRPGMYDPEPRMKDMDDEGIDVAVLFPPGSGEEWALGDVDFSVALCRTLNDARAEYASHDPDRLKLVAKLPMIEPKAAAEELERCVTEHGFVGLVTATHIREKNLDDPSFDPVWEAAERLNVAVCTHGGGQAPGQTPLMIDRFDTRLGTPALTPPPTEGKAVNYAKKKGKGAGGAIRIALETVGFTREGDALCAATPAAWAGAGAAWRCVGSTWPSSAPTRPGAHETHSADAKRTHGTSREPEGRRRNSLAKEQPAE